MGEINREGIILAAGYSSRAGAFKMELPVNGVSVLENIIRAMQGLCSRIIIVSGYNKEELENLVDRIKRKKENQIFSKKLVTIYNPDFDRGMFSSVKTGVRALIKNNFFLTPGDYPLLENREFKLLLPENGEIDDKKDKNNKKTGENTGRENRVYIPSYQGKKGHPIYFYNFDRNIILDHPDDSNLRECLKNLDTRIVRIESESILLDLDTQEDYRHIIQKSRERSSAWTK